VWGDGKGVSKGAYEYYCVTYIHHNCDEAFLGGLAISVGEEGGREEDNWWATGDQTFEASIDN